MKIYVAVRPFVVNTLKQLKRAGVEVILYSASQSNYTTAILKVLFKQRVEFHHIVWAEEHEKATKPNDGSAVKKINTKNINIFLHNRTPKDIMIVDWKVQGFAYNITNGIYVPPFEGPPNDNNPNTDTFFMYLFEYLKGFKDVSDVRQKIQKEFDIKNLFCKNFKNPAMDKLKSLVNNEKEKKEISTPEKWSTPKIETTFRRNSRVIQDYEEILKFQKYQNDLQMESISELPEKA